MNKEHQNHRLRTVSSKKKKKKKKKTTGVLSRFYWYQIQTPWLNQWHITEKGVSSVGVANYIAANEET